MTRDLQQATAFILETAVRDLEGYYSHPVRTESSRIIAETALRTIEVFIELYKLKPGALFSFPSSGVPS